MESPLVRRALISVSDKTGLADFAAGLAAAGVQILSTGGTRRFLQAAGLEVQDVATYTGFPEMMDGRVKTLHPKIFAGILCRRDRADDMAALAQHQISPLELVVVNLYPFRETVAKPDVTEEEAIEQIDIGGPSLVRAAAKNHAFTAIATQPRQYPEILAEVRSSGRISLDLRRRLAAAAFAHTAEYDKAVAAYFAEHVVTDARSAGVRGCGSAGVEDKHSTNADNMSQFPAGLDLSLVPSAELRYGENPHQMAAVYVWLQAAAPGATLVTARQLNGKELSYNNLLDLDSALAMVRGLPGPAVAVVKHNNPCGAATNANLSTAAELALEGDAVSAFGSVLAFNRPLDEATAEVLVAPGRFIEAVVAPGFDPQSLEILTTRPKWKDNVRLLEVSTAAEPAGGELHLRSIDGGFLVQTLDAEPDDEAAWRVTTKARPDDAAFADLRFAWAMVRHVKSNAIVLCQGGCLVGVGAGQMSRVDSVQIAIRKAGDRAAGSVLASDAFFPFADSIHEAAQAGIKAIIQPGGSKRDGEVIAACDQAGIAMLFTGRRHFRH